MCSRPISKAEQKRIQKAEEALEEVKNCIQTLKTLYPHALLVIRLNFRDYFGVRLSQNWNSERFSYNSGRGANFLLHK